MNMETKRYGRSDFLTSIFDLFNKREVTENLKRTYDIALTCPYSVDWYNLYKHVAETCETRILPMPKYFKDLLPKFKKREFKEGVYDGCLVCVYLVDGRRYDFEISEQIGTTKISDIKNRFKENLEAIIKYPKGTLVIGEEIIYPEEEQQNCEILWKGEE